MNKLIYPDPSNGIRVFFEDLEYIFGLNTYDSGVIQAIEHFLRNFGTDFIVYGCADLGGGVTADGWIMLSSELIRVKQHSRGSNGYFEKITETNSTGDREDASSNMINVWQQNRGTATAVSGNLLYNGTTLRELIFKGGYVELVAVNEEEKILTNTDSYVLVNKDDPGGGDKSYITVPNPSSLNNGDTKFINVVNFNWDGQDLVLRQLDSTVIKTFTSGTQTLDHFVVIQSDGSSWRIIFDKHFSTYALKTYVASELTAKSTLNTKVVNIGDWNMDATGNVNISHGIADFTKIRSVKVLIRNDADSQLRDLYRPDSPTAGGYVDYIDSSIVRLGRAASGEFDSTNYDSTSFNRGWIIIEHLP